MSHFNQNKAFKLTNDIIKIDVSNYIKKINVWRLNLKST